MMFIKRFCLIMVVLVGCISQQEIRSFQAVDCVRGALVAKDILGGIALNYVVQIGATVVHELGHALTAKWLWGAPIKVVIGGEPGDKGYDQAIKSPRSITFVGFKGGGGTHIDDLSERSKKEPMKAAAICAAGPLATLISAPLFGKVMAKALIGIGCGWQERSYQFLWTYFARFYGISALIDLVPIGNSDGAWLCHLLGINKTVATVAVIALQQYMLLYGHFGAIRDSLRNGVNTVVNGIRHSHQVSLPAVMRLLRPDKMVGM